MARNNNKPLTEEEREKWGDVVASCRFPTRMVMIYSKGFVKVAHGPLLNKGEVEKLIAISGQTDITKKKSDFGRAVGAMATLGLNLLSPSQRGNLYLSIATETNSYSLFTGTPDTTSIKDLNLVVIAGQKAIAMRDGDGQPAESVTPEQSNLAEQLERLSKLHENGNLSDAEYAEAKAKLLGS